MIEINKNEIEDIINSLESMQCEMPFSHGQSEVTEYIPKIIQFISLYPEYLELKEKSIPVLPTKCSEYAFRDYRYCRKCNAYVGDARLSFRQKPFCCVCGQAVLWEK